MCHVLLDRLHHDLVVVVVEHQLFSALHVEGLAAVGEEQLQLVLGDTPEEDSTKAIGGASSSAPFARD